MIELNLLPKELRHKKKKRPMPKIPIIPIFVGVMGVLIVIHLLLILLINNNKGLLVTLNKKWDQMQPQREETGKIAKEINDLEKRLAAVRALAKPDKDWTEILNGLNQAVITNVWLYSLEMKQKREFVDTGKNKAVRLFLHLRGYALGKSEQATSLVAKFINSLKKNGDFSDYFDGIELRNMTSLQVSGEEAMMFELSCRFKQTEDVKAAGKKPAGRTGKR